MCRPVPTPGASLVGTVCSFSMTCYMLNAATKLKSSDICKIPQWVGQVRWKRGIAGVLLPALGPALLYRVQRHPDLLSVDIPGQLEQDLERRP